METGKQTTLTKKKDDVVVLFTLINFYSLVRSVLLTSLSGATQAEGQLTEVTARDVKAISTGRSQIIFANGVEVRKITCSDDDDDDTTSKGKLTLDTFALLSKKGDCEIEYRKFLKRFCQNFGDSSNLISLFTIRCFCKFLDTEFEN